MGVDGAAVGSKPIVAHREVDALGLCCFGQGGFNGGPSSGNGGGWEEADADAGGTLGGDGAGPLPARDNAKVEVYGMLV